MSYKFKVLFVDDDKDVLEAFSDYIQEEGYDIDTFETIASSIKALNSDQYSVAIIDMDFPAEPEGGIQIVNHIKVNNIDTKPIILTGRGSIKNFRKVFVDIYDYIEKGENAIDDLLACLKKLKEFNELININKQIEEERNQLEMKLKQSEISKKVIQQRLELSDKSIKTMENKFNQSEIRRKDIEQDLHQSEKNRIAMEQKLENSINSTKVIEHELKKALENRTIIEQELEQSEHSKEIRTPVYQSAHTFEKCYNIPTRNLCYRIRQKIPLRYQEAHDLVDFIDHSIDLWANLFSMELNDPRTGKIAQNQVAIEEIDTFKWGDLKEDLYQFVEQNFIMNINDLFDHYTNEYFKLGAEIVTLSDIYDKEFPWHKFVKFTIEGDDNIQLKGVLPYFRATLINLITNAVEALDFYDVFKNSSKNRQQISVICKQSGTQTNIELFNTGKPILKNRVDCYNQVIFDLAKKGKLQLSENELENDIREKKFTSKPGIGSGYALIHAAHYFSRIELKQADGIIKRGYMEIDESVTDSTRFFIKLPFGKSKNNEICFRWKRTESKSDHYKKEKEEKEQELEPDKDLPDCTQHLKSIQQVSEQKEVLIVEDSRPDRFRMGMLIDDLNFLHRRFAWDAQRKAVLSVDTILALMKITKPKILILDLAWTPRDEKNIHEMLFTTREGVEKKVNEDKPHSFDLLERITKNSKDYVYLDIIIIMSQFVPPTSDGLISYINKKYFHIKKPEGKIFHKWRQEEEFRKTLLHYHRS